MFSLIPVISFSEELKLKCDVKTDSLKGTSILEDVRYFGKSFIIRTDKKFFITNPENEVNILHGLSSIKKPIDKINSKNSKNSENSSPFKFILSYSSIEQVKSRNKYEKLFYKYKGTLEFLETTNGKEYYLFITIISYNGDPKEYEKDIIRNEDGSRKSVKRRRLRDGPVVYPKDRFYFKFPCKKIANNREQKQ